MLDTQGDDLTDNELLDYISEATVMSKTIDEYEGRKSADITTAKRLGEFLGDERLKDKVGGAFILLLDSHCSLSFLMLCMTLDIMFLRVVQSRGSRVPTLSPNSPQA